MAGLGLNALWEFVQCGFFYEMDGGWMRGLLWMLFAVLGDGVLVMGVFWSAVWLVGRRSVVLPDARGWCALLVLGLACGLLVEWLARWLGLWRYGPLMPTVEVFGTTIGLSPIAQMLLLPSLSVFIVSSTERREGKEEDGKTT